MDENVKSFTGERDDKQRDLSLYEDVLTKLGVEGGGRILMASRDGSELGRRPVRRPSGATSWWKNSDGTR
jgi:hypothetical protein